MTIRTPPPKSPIGSLIRIDGAYGNFAGNVPSMLNERHTICRRTMGGAIRAAIEACGASLVLPFYSPGFNPIENAYA